MLGQGLLPPPHPHWTAQCNELRTCKGRTSSGSCYLSPPLRALCRACRAGKWKSVGAMDCLLAVFPTHRPTHSAFAQSGAPAPCHLQTAGGSQSGRKKARSLCTQSPLWQPRACSHDAWGQRGFRLHSRPTAQPICSKSCPFLIVGLPHPEDIRVRACFWIIFCFLIYFFVFFGVSVSCPRVLTRFPFNLV